MASDSSPDPYRADLARVLRQGFGFFAEGCAPGVLGWLAPLLETGGVVLELARAEAPGADVRRLTLPDAPLPSVDAVVSVGHVLSYLRDEAAIERALGAVAAALRPGGVLEGRGGAGPPHRTAEPHGWTTPLNCTAPRAPRSDTP